MKNLANDYFLCTSISFDKKKELTSLFLLTLPLLYVFQYISFINKGYVILVYLLGAMMYVAFNHFNKLKSKLNRIVFYFMLPICLWGFIKFGFDKSANLYNMILASTISLFYSLKIFRCRVKIKSIVFNSWIFFAKILYIQVGLTIGAVVLERYLDLKFPFDVLFLLGVMVVCFFILSLSIFYYLRNLNKKSILESNAITSSKSDVLELKKHEKDSINRLISFFENSSTYLDNNFDFETLSYKTEIPKRELSRIIKLAYDSSFYQLLASKRIETVLLKLKNLDNHYTIESVMIDSGFSSKSVFNKHFKNIVGMTPSQYVLSLKRG